MNRIWQEIHLCVPAAGIDLVCSELADLGCEGVTVEERPLDTFIPPDPDEAPAGPCHIKAYFPADDGAEALCARIVERLHWLARFVPGLTGITPRVRTMQQEDWAEGWKQNFGLQRIGRRLVVKPSWEDYRPRGDEVVIDLDPGMAFGTGTHATTRLCLQALADAFDHVAPPRRVLDVGTGSGILAIAAAALGAERVLACDIEAEACRVAAENAAGNGIGQNLEITDRPLTELKDDFDVVLANILAEENIRLASELVCRLAPGGRLVLSGILREKEAQVAAAFARYGLCGPETFQREEWVCMVYRREG